jgi:UDP-N-acetylglucosamine 1-carboxyvinyltransferase
MDQLIIEGGRRLCGEITVSGAKNAALPILMATILLDSPSTLHNIPDLADIRTTLRLLELLGCPGERDRRTGTCRIAPGALRPEAPYDLVKTMRASVLCLGPLLAKLGRAKVSMPGGCGIGARPINLHLLGLEAMGARFELVDGYIVGRCPGLRGAQITFDFPTVGGTENLLMAAALADGRTVLSNAAREPEIVDLANFLNACGAKISGHGSGEICVEGVTSLRGADYTVMPDRIEAGTFLVAAAITGGDLLVRGCPWEELEAVISKLRSMGLPVEHTPEGTRAACAGGARALQSADVTTQPFPGFPTDMQAQMMALLCLTQGSGSIDETVFENRFMHAQELIRMGADIRLSGRTALVRGKPRLIGAPVMASDLRASASLVLAGLAAEGATTVQRIYHLDRGYERMEAKFNACGARIRRERAS